MRNVIRRIVVVLLVLNLLLPWFFVTPVYAAPGQFDMDIIFLLDNSGSMRYADRHPSPPHPPARFGAGVRRQAWLAASAANLFIDMSSSFDTRIGYVMYTHRIERSRPLSEIISPATRQEVQRGIQGMTYGGYTDIARALNYALDIFENEPDRSRPAAIIFLSDGDVHFPGGRDADREVGREEALVAAQRAADMGIPIHTVGFDFADPITGDVDPADEQLLRDMTAIANGTIAIAPEAADLPVVMRNIFAALTGAAVMPVYSGPVTGYPQEFEIDIPHNSIIQASITAMTSQPLEYVYLYNPAGVRLQAAEYERAEDINGLYTKLTMRLPIMGTYTLRFLGTAGDTISIDLLSIYDKVLVQNPPTSGIGEAEFSWRLETSAGDDIDDPTFIASLAPTIYATNHDTGITYTFQFDLGQTVMTVPLSEGFYSAYLRYGAVTSNTETFEVDDVVIYPCIVIMPIVSRTLWTIIPGLNTSNIQLNEVIYSPMDNWPLSGTGTPGEWEDHVEFSFNRAGFGDYYITLTASGAGSADDLRVTVTNVHGYSVDFIIEVTVISGFILIGGLLALILLSLLLIILVGKSKKPFMNDPMGKLHIKMSIPMSHVTDPPPEYMLSLPRIKGRKSLRELINMNVGIAEPYRLAFEQISWFADQAIVSAKTKQLLEIKIPQNPAYQVKVDKMAKPSAIFDKNGGTEIRIGFEDPNSGYDEYIIELGHAGLQTDMSQTGSFMNDSFDLGGPSSTSGPPKQDDNFW